MPLTITKVTTDDQVYEAPTDFLTLLAGVKRVIFGFNAISFKTRPAGMRYYHRLIGREVDWQPPIISEEIQYFNLLPGDYAFEVQAVDRDLNYSTPTTLNFTVPTPFHKTALFLVPTVGGSAILLGILVMQTILFFKRRRQVSVYQGIAVEEIKAAREMQLSLLPETEDAPIASRNPPQKSICRDIDCPNQSSRLYIDTFQRRASRTDFTEARNAGEDEYERIRMWNLLKSTCCPAEARAGVGRCHPE